MLFNINTYKLEGFSEINLISNREKMEKKNEYEDIEMESIFSSNQSSQCISHNKKFDHVVIGLDNGSISIRKSIKNLSLKFCDDVSISNAPILDVKFSPNDNFLAIISEDKKLTILKVDKEYSILKIFSDIGGTPRNFDWDINSNYIQIDNDKCEYLIYSLSIGQIKSKNFIKIIFILFYFILFFNYEDYTIPELKKLVWATQNCKYGYQIQGVFCGLSNDSLIRSIEKFNNNMFIAVGRDENSLDIFNYPCISENHKFKSYRYFKFYKI